MRARHRVGKLLLRLGHVYYGGKAWTGQHDAWLRRIRFDQTGSRVAFETAYESVQLTAARRDRWTPRSPRWPPTGSTPHDPAVELPAGISTLTGFALAVEIGDWDRFTGATIGAYLGLVPSEHSSGDAASQGGITKTGNTHARRLLIEAAWHHKPLYRPGKTILEPAGPWPPRRSPPAATPATGACTTDGSRSTARKKHTVANTAIARELAGWCWSLAVMEA